MDLRFNSLKEEDRRVPELFWFMFHTEELQQDSLIENSGTQQRLMKEWLLPGSVLLVRDDPSAKSDRLSKKSQRQGGEKQPEAVFSSRMCPLVLLEL